jgi:hypothetical protein
MDDLCRELTCDTVPLFIKKGPSIKAGFIYNKSFEIAIHLVLHNIKD